MTDQERIEAFTKDLEVVYQKHGLMLVAQLKPEMLGEVLQVRPVLAPAAIPNWTPKES